MNVEGKNEVKTILEYQVTVVTDGDHGWMLKLVGQVWGEIEYLHSLKIYSWGMC